MELKIKRLHKDALVPIYATDDAACFDLHAVIETIGGATVHPGEGVSIGTGLAFEVPPGWALLIYSRSGHGFKHGVRLVNAVGVLDADFRGEARVGLHNEGFRPFKVNHGDRIAQAMLVQAPRVTLVEVAELSDTARGAGGLGSTGL